MRDEDARAGARRYARRRARGRAATSRLFRPLRRATFRLLSDGGVMAQGAGGLMVSVSGIRGRVGEALTPEVVATLRGGVRRLGAGAAAARAAIVVGRDSRVSGPMFHRIVVRRAAVGRLRRDRHRPDDDADLPARRRAPPRGGRADALGQPQPDRVERAQVHRPERAVPRGERRRRDARARRDGHSARDVGPARRGDAGRRRGARGTSTPCSRSRTSTSRRSARAGSRSRSTACAARARRSCRRCSSGSAARWSAINLEPDGRFPRAPEPVAENLGELERLVRESGADIGFAVDPDVDRLALSSTRGGRSARTTRSRSRRGSCCGTGRARW